MNNEARQLAQQLEQIVREVLGYCQELPERVFQWPLPLPGDFSFSMLAMELSKDIDSWIFQPLKGFSMFSSKSERASFQNFAELRCSYETWIEEVHRLLDVFPDALIDTFVKIPCNTTSIQANIWQHKGSELPLRVCFLEALTRCARWAGQMKLIRMLFDDGERISQEIQLLICE